MIHRLLKKSNKFKITIKNWSDSFFEALDYCESSNIPFSIDLDEKNASIAFSNDEYRLFFIMKFGNTLDIVCN